MKKLNLNVSNLNATEILSREELKKVLGGTEGSGNGTSTTCTATCSKNGSTITCTSSKNDCKVLYEYVGGPCNAVQCDSGVPGDIM
jgi:hypothetical protein